MDQCKQLSSNETQVKSEIAFNNSPKVCETPLKKNEIKTKHSAYQSTTGSFTMLPSHITPPSGLTKFIARNPFESDLTNRLHLSTISPTVFNKVSSPSQGSPPFVWNVEELALIQPAKIEEFPIQLHCVDPDLEVKAQAAIDKFFDENQIIPSPWEVKRKETNIKPMMITPNRPIEDLNLTKESSKLRKDGWSQTILSLPAQLPLHVENILKPYFTFTQDQGLDNDDINSSNNSLRRKLFFNHDDYHENDKDSSVSLSPVKINGSLVLSCSPAQSGMFVHGTPLKNYSGNIQCNYGTPAVNSENFSPLNMSPIYNGNNNMSYESLRLTSRSAIRLDFSGDTGVEHSLVNKESSERNTASLDTYRDPESGDRRLDSCDTISRPIGEYNEVIDRIMPITDLYKTCMCDKYPVHSTNIVNHLGESGHQNVSAIVQDTGYQTYSMNSTNNVIENCNNNPFKQKMHVCENILISENELQISGWKESMKNVFCSTPSKHNNNCNI